jgi:hypothetical protein
MTPDSTQSLLPSGAAGCTEWEFDAGVRSRIVYSGDRTIDGHTFSAHISVIQHEDGLIESAVAAPNVFAPNLFSEGLTSSQSRALAALLTQVAEEADRWILECHAACTRGPGMRATRDHVHTSIDSFGEPNSTSRQDIATS